MKSLYEERQTFSNKKIEDLRNKIKALPILNSFSQNFCIYVTGSFGRKEASEYSDVDIFFMCSNKNDYKNLDKILLDAELIKIMRDMKLPDFSDDGIFLKIHCIDDIIEKLGAPDDDYNNHFSARMLLLLESKPLYNTEFYDKCLLNIINHYFKDYHSHEKTFEPVFLANDIIRFWKTMCLNYENKRHRRGNLNPEAKNKSHLKNLKLKFARLNTCYSLIACLLHCESYTIEILKKLVEKTPLERLISLKETNQIIVNNLIETYSWFLGVTGKSDKNVLSWIGSKKNRDEAFSKGRDFHSNFYLLLKAKEPELLKFITI